MRKLFRGLICGLLAIILTTNMAGCQKEEPQKAEKESVVLWHYWGQGSSRQSLRKLVMGFNESQEQYEVILRYVQDADLKKQLVLAMADGEAPDLALIDFSDLRFYDYAQPLVDLSGRIEGWEYYVDKVKQNCTIDGRVCAIPFGINLLAMYYNVDALQEAGVAVPETMEELVSAAAALSRDGRYGFGISAIQSEESMYNFLPFLWSQGGTENRIDSAESKKAFALIQQMVQQESVSRQCINMTPGDLTQQFAEGNLAIMFNTGMVRDNILAENPDLNFDVTYLPTGEAKLTILGGEVFAIPQGGNREGALAFLQYVSDPERMASYLDEMGLVAPREDVQKQQYPKDETMQVFVKSMQHSATREYSEKWPRISLVVTEALTDSIIGRQELDSILHEAAASIREIREEQP